MISSLIIAILLNYNNGSFDTEHKILIVKNKNIECQESNLYDINLILNTGEIIYKMSCIDHDDYFSYICLVKKENYTFLIFNEYSNLAGLIKVHFLDIRDMILYSTDFMGETKIPLPLTVNIGNRTISALDIDNGNYLVLPLQITWQKSKSEKKKLEIYEVIKEIDND